VPVDGDDCLGKGTEKRAPRLIAPYRENVGASLNVRL